MSYEKINSVPQFNFQINWVLTYGKLTCNTDLIQEKTEHIRNFDEWWTVWKDLDKRVEEKEGSSSPPIAFVWRNFFMKETDG